MPSFELYQKMLGGVTDGQARKRDSDMIMEATWDEDINSTTIFLYDQAHDDQFDIEEDLDPRESKTKIPVEVKFYEIEYNSLSKDEVGQHLMFKPSFNYWETIPYYEETFGKPFKASFPDGMYFDALDSQGEYQRWLCVGSYRRYANQFPSYIALPVDFKARWIYQNKKMESWGALRSQSSYNSGVWTGDRLTSIENQKLLWLPMNNTTKTIFYDQRIAISQDRDIPVVWSCSKVEDMNVFGVVRYTFKQDLWDEHNDYIERDETGELLGIWCDYFKSNVPIEEPDEPTPDPSIYSEVTYSGRNTNVTIKGNFKKFTVTFYDANGEIALRPGEWTFTINGEDAKDLLTIKTSDDDSTLSSNQIKLKFIGDDLHIGENLVVSYESDDHIKSYVTMNLIGL